MQADAHQKAPGDLPEPPRLSYRPREIARMTGLSRASAYRLIETGSLRAVRVGRTWLIPADAVHELIASARSQGRDPERIKIPSLESS